MGSRVDLYAVLLRETAIDLPVQLVSLAIVELRRERHFRDDVGGPESRDEVGVEAQHVDFEAKTVFAKPETACSELVLDAVSNEIRDTPGGPDGGSLHPEAVPLRSDPVPVALAPVADVDRHAHLLRAGHGLRDEGPPGQVDGFIRPCASPAPREKNPENRPGPTRLSHFDGSSRPRRDAGPKALHLASGTLPSAVRRRAWDAIPAVTPEEGSHRRAAEAHAAEGALSKDTSRCGKEETRRVPPRVAPTRFEFPVATVPGRR